MNTKQIFQYISYLQYPLMLIALFYAFRPYTYGLGLKPETSYLLFKDINNVLVFMGLGISFSTLQDTTKTQNKLSRKIWENPKKGKIAIFAISLMTLFIIVNGLIGYFSTTDSKLKELSSGIIILGIGMIGLLKSAIEMFENHRKDKNVAIEKEYQ
ncbi:hypothetical protein [Chondrinema litorale]|uniref:hypothetical protein n=1 Tax=Chondrinema litorale TaxID=2994555 RepID=UPI0025434533|nr:hypothetical protein [Chondrinema litorale]UZR99724.1 hypothetical protein OQ292_38180 [Chondrinema litorale]